MSEAAKSKNFSSAEKDVLMSMIELHRDVIECKRTDTVTTRNKDVVWDKISTEFNALGLSKRTAKQIRLWWENQKKRARSRLAQNRVNTVKTGGGPCEWSSDPWDERVAGIVASNFMPLKNEFDCDALYTETLDPQALMALFVSIYIMQYECILKYQIILICIFTQRQPNPALTSDKLMYAKPYQHHCPVPHSQISNVYPTMLMNKYISLDRVCFILHT